jgi:hypothetical protein
MLSSRLQSYKNHESVFPIILCIPKHFPQQKQHKFHNYTKLLKKKLLDSKQSAYHLTYFTTGYSEVIHASGKVPSLQQFGLQKDQHIRGTTPTRDQEFRTERDISSDMTYELKPPSTTA